MLKNFNILKGITVSLVLALLLCGGILLKNYADAATSTVVYYLSDSGDNTTGADEATAFHTIDDAIRAVNAKKLEPGSTVKLIVVDRLTLTTQIADSVVAVDAQGNRLPVTLTSLDGASSKDDFSEVYLTFINSGATSGGQYVTFNNDWTFKNIRILNKVHEAYTQFNPSLTYRFLQKTYYFAGQSLTLDNVEIKPERDGSDVPPLLFYLDANAASSDVAYHKNVTIKDCDFSYKTTTYCHGFALPYVDMTVTTENSSFETVYMSYTSSTSQTDDLKSLTVNFNAGTSVKTLYYNRSSSHLGIPGGITFNYRDCYVGTITGASKTTGSTIVADITHNFYGADIGTFYGAGYGKVEGSITNNVYEGTTINKFRGGGSGSTVTISGPITNNIDSATLTGEFYAGPTGAATYSSIVNNISNSTFGGKLYCGGNASGDSITSKLYNVSVASTFFGGNYEGDCKTLTTEFVNSSTSKEYYGGGVKGTYGEITNTFENSSTGSEFYGGIQAGTVTNITNNFKKGTNIGTRSYCGNYGSNGAKITGTLTNNFYDGATFNNTVHCSGRYDSIFGSVVNNFYGGTFKTVVNGGVRQPKSAGSYAEDPDKHIANIYNNFYGGSFTTFYGGQNEAGSRVSNAIVNVVNGGTFSGEFVCGNLNGDVNGTITTTINGGIFKGQIIAGNKATGNVDGKITTKVNGGTISAGIVGISAFADAKFDSATLTFAPADSTTALSVSGNVKAYEGLTTTLVGGNQPMSINNKTNIVADTLTGTLMVSKTDTWAEDQVYITLATPVSADCVKSLNASSVVTGSGVFDGTVLVGSAAAGVEANAPVLADLISFYLDEKLGVCFWVPKDEINQYIQKTGNWGYTVLLSGQTVSAETFTAVDSFPVGSVQTYQGVEYFTFNAGVGVSSTEFSETIAVNLAGVLTADYTVYELLERGIDCNAADPVVVRLLSAIHTYGVEAYNIFKDGNLPTQYYAGFTGDYSAPAQLTSTRGYGFVGSNMTLDEQVSLNFYLKSVGDVSFKVFDKATGNEVDASKITVIPVSGNRTYNYVVSLKLTVPEMVNFYTVKAYAGGSEVASCTYSLANCCDAYLYAEDWEQAKYGGVSYALLAYIEAAQEYLSRI